MACAVMILFLHDVGIVASAFDHARVGSVATAFGASLVDFLDGFG